MPNTFQIDGKAAYDLFEKSSYGKGVLAVISGAGDVLWSTPAYYAVAQNVDVEEIHLLVNQSAHPPQTPALPELIQRGKLALWVNTGKGEKNVVVAYGTGTVLTNPSVEQDMIRDFILAFPDKEMQALSSESSSPENVYILKLIPSLLKHHKDLSEPLLISAYKVILQ